MFTENRCDSYSNSRCPQFVVETCLQACSDNKKWFGFLCGFLQKDYSIPHS